MGKVVLTARIDAATANAVQRYANEMRTTRSAATDVLLAAGLEKHRLAAEHDPHRSNGGHRTNGRDEDPDESNGDQVELPRPVVPRSAPVEPPMPPAARPERIRPPELSQALKSIAYTIIQEELGDCFVGEKAILREHLWFVLAADPRRRFMGLCERATAEGAGRRHSPAHLYWLRAHIVDDPDMVELIAAEHNARLRGQTVLQIIEN
jgi:hypothetical protein